MNQTTWLDDIHWSPEGLIPAIAQDVKTGKILMLAWMNREALALTAQEGRAVYWSRSRHELWRKGEQSGHIQQVSEIRLDCDDDVILLVIEQVGGIACHTGRESCFYKKLSNDHQWQLIDPVKKDPKVIYADR